MKFSLLYKNYEENEICDILYDLSVDKCAGAFCDDPRRVDYFLSVIMKPLANSENIVYRQQILRDFMTIPKLYDDVKLIFNRYDKAKNDWRELRSGIYPSGSAVNSRALLDYTFSSLKVTAIFPKTIISFFRSIYDVLSKYQLTSSGLIGMKNYCADMIENNSLNEIAEIASLFQYHTPEQFDFSVMCALDDTLKLISCDLCGITDAAEKPDSGNIFKNLFKKKGSGEPKAASVEDDDETVSNTVYIINEALHRIDSALSQVTNDVYEIFFGISNELLFYDAALMYINFTSDRGLECAMPEILPCEADTFAAEKLCDLNLLCEGKDYSELTTHDVNILKSDKGILMRGLNKTGKTSYLRGIGIAQLFAQAGLPICASNAKISIRNAIFSHFSAAEEEFRAGDTSGRFEGEVQLIAKIVNSLRPYSMILLNETFQTTSYTEGAEGIGVLLDILPEAKVKYVFVTRLTKLFDIIEPGNVIMLSTGAGKNPYEITKYEHNR